MQIHTELCQRFQVGWLGKREAWWVSHSGLSKSSQGPTLTTQNVIILIQHAVRAGNHLSSNSNLLPLERCALVCKALNYKCFQISRGLLTLSEIGSAVLWELSTDPRLSLTQRLWPLRRLREMLCPPWFFLSLNICEAQISEGCFPYAHAGSMV